jgi:hypothetical protein
MRTDRDFSCDELDILVHALWDKTEKTNDPALKSKIQDVQGMFAAMRGKPSADLSNIINIRFTLKELEWINGSLSALDDFNMISADPHYDKNFMILKMKIEQKLNEQRQGDEKAGE